MTNDISPILESWEFKSDNVTVRRIKGLDGHMKLQMRLELGLLQMEMEGRPDGKRPYNRESLLDYYVGLLEQHQKFFGGDEGFELDAEACTALRQESLIYYYRYLGLFHLEDYQGVIRDTERNMQVFDLIWQYSTEDCDRWMLEQYRPYVIMMNTRAKALLSLQDGDYERALQQVEEGTERIEDFFKEHDREDFMDSCPELSFLTQWIEDIRTRKPPTAKDKLLQLLKEAVEREHYEHAAKLRDAIRKLDQAP
ncbi:MAG: UvrB/UvrC motif-containing protein [Armatimonadetes bacterium]|nr:UvrB/UvrC motif-containing protein [Armatimonadota bacterium]